jgi:hypothetical protein
MDTAKALRRASLEAKRLRVEARGRKNVHQEGALAALPQGYGVDAPHVAGSNEMHQLQNQDASSLLAQNPRLQNNHFHPIVVEGGPPHPQAQAGAARTGTVVTPVPVRTVNGGAIQAQGQMPQPLQVPTVDKFVAMAVPPPAPNAGAELPAAPGQAGTANNVACKVAVAAQRFVTNAAIAGVGQPIVVDEADAAAMHWPCHIDNMEVIDEINHAILALMNLIGEAIRAKGASAVVRVSTAAAVAGGTGDTRTDDAKLELLQKQCKLAIEVGDSMLIAHCKRMIRMMEERELREMEGGN